MARRAWALDDLALAATARAGGHVDHLAEHRLAHASDLTTALTRRAGRRRVPGPRPPPPARVGSGGCPELDPLLRPLARLFEGDARVIAQIRARLGSAAPSRARRCAAEE